MATDGPRRDCGPLDRVMGPSSSQYQQSVPSLAGGAATAAGGVSHDMMASLLAAAKRSVAHSLPAAPTPSVSTLLGAGFAGCAPPPDRAVSSYPMPVAAPAAAPVDTPAALALAALSARSPGQVCVQEGNRGDSRLTAGWLTSCGCRLHIRTDTEHALG